MSKYNKSTLVPHIFLHIPKTGGTAIEALPWVGGEMHQTHIQYIYELRSEIDDAIVWSVVRDPECRLISAWRGYHSYPDSYNADDVFQFADINDWISWLYADRRRMFWHLHTHTQMSFVEPIENVVLIPYVEGENIQENEKFKKLCKTITGDDSKVEKRNIGVSNPDNNLTDHSKNIIRKMYLDDFILFDRAIKTGV